MKTFERYFISLIGLCLAIMAVFCVLLYIDNSSLLQPIFVLIMWFCALLFSVPIALLYASWAKIKIINMGQLGEEELTNLEKIICINCKRKIVVRTENATEYRMEGRYKSWLTNAAVIEKKNGEYILKIPSIFADEIREKFSIKERRHEK